MPTKLVAIGSWPTIVATVLVGLVAICLAWPQIFPSAGQANQMTLENLDKRVAYLRQATDPLQREQLGIGLAAYGRAIDRAIPKDARVFLSGMIGKDHASRGGYYFFLRNYLFPRDVEISLNEPAQYLSDDSVWMRGVDCESPEVLRTNGFDLFLHFKDDNGIDIIPLTERGVPKQ